MLSAALCILAGSQSAVRAQQADAEARRLFQAARQAQAREAYAEAAQDYLEVIRILPRAAEAYASLGLVYNAENEFEKSARALEQAQRFKPGLPGVALYLGIDRVKLHQPLAAIHDLKQATREEPSNPQAWLWLGAAETEADQAQDAIEALRQAVRLRPADPETLFRLGEALKNAADSQMGHALSLASGQPYIHLIYGDLYMDEGQWVKAAGHYRRLLAEDPGSREAYLRLGEVELRQGRIAEAREALHAVPATDPLYAGAQSALAKAALLEGDPAQALELLQSSIAKDPLAAAAALGLPPIQVMAAERRSGQSNGQMRRVRAQLEQAGLSPARTLALAYVCLQFDEAEASSAHWRQFESALPLPRGGNALMRARDAFARGKADMAEQQARQWLQKNPADAKATYLLARSYRSESMTVLEQLVAAAPDSFPAHTLLGESCENAENYEKALAEYRKAEATAPDLPGLHYAIGRLLNKTGDPEKALAEFKLELGIDPNHPGANAEMGSILVDRDEQEKGLMYLKKAVSLDPGLWPAHQKLGQAYFQQKQFAQAEAELSKAVEHDPDGAAHYQLGLVYRALGRAEAARAMLAKARQIQSEQLADINAAKSIPETAQP